METLSNGYQKPADGDRGSVFWDALRNNAQKTNDHVHDGATGVAIASKYLSRQTAAVSASTWVATGDMFKKAITMPSGYTWGACEILAFLHTDSSQIFPKMVKTGASAFDLYMPTDNVAVDLLYT